MQPQPLGSHPTVSRGNQRKRDFAVRCERLEIWGGGGGMLRAGVGADTEPPTRRCWGSGYGRGPGVGTSSCPRCPHLARTVNKAIFFPRTAAAARCASPAGPDPVPAVGGAPLLPAPPSTRPRPPPPSSSSSQRSGPG